MHDIKKPTPRYTNTIWERAVEIITAKIKKKRKKEHRSGSAESTYS